MTRFALLPLAFFANACADTEGFDDALTGSDTEVREMIELADVNTERSSSAKKPAQARLVRMALARFGKETIAQGCEPVGAAFGTWKDNRYQYRGTMVDMNAKPFAAIKGYLSHDGYRDGEFNGLSVKSSDEAGRLTIEGDWHRGDIQADIFSTAYKQNHPMLSMTGSMKFNTNDGTGQFVALISDCR